MKGIHLNTITVPLSWKDILWGYNHGYLTEEDIIQYANSVDIGDDERISELCIQDKRYKVKIESLIDEIADELIDYDDSKWLFILLQHLYSIKDNVADPLGIIEEIYADFGYPEEIRHFVRYMPSDNYNPQAHSFEENIDRLYFLWKSYLIDKEKIYLENSD